MKKVLVFYPHFLPAFKAGGPIQSIANLVNLLGDEIRFDIVCSASEYGEKGILPGIAADQWNAYSDNVRVYYLAMKGDISALISQSNPDVIFINGVFEPRFNIWPLILARKFNARVILSPRGMLQEGALKIKPFKKKIFLSFFKALRLQKNIRWHATDAQEKADIQRLFGAGQDVVIAGNIPKPIRREIPIIEKRKGELKLIYLSLISEKKNLHILLEALKNVREKVSLDIYGPIKDESYWIRCKEMIVNMHGQSVRYQGTVLPDQVQDILTRYHALVLPTKGENFGHAIFESFSVARPALISPYTPWGDLAKNDAGITVQSESVEDWASSISVLAQADQLSFDLLSRGALSIARQYFAENNFREQYNRLFFS